MINMLSNTTCKNAVLIALMIAGVFCPISAEANYGDFSGGVAIGSSYAGVDTAPTDGLIVQGNVAIGATAMSGFPAAQLQVELGTNLDNTTTAGGFVWSSGSVAANDNRSVAQYNGGGITFQGIYDAGGDYSTYGWIRAFKNTATSGDYTGGLLLSTRAGNMIFKTQSDNGILDNLTTGFSMVITSSGNVGIGTTTPSSKLDVNGTIHVGSLAGASSTTVCLNSNVFSSCSSARRYKENIEPSSLGLDEVLAMKPVTFDFKDHKDDWEKHDFGFIAEEMEQINPLFVTYDEKGRIEGVRYMQLTAVEAKAIQELHSMVEKQQNEIEDLKQMIEQLKHQ